MNIEQVASLERGQKLPLQRDVEAIAGLDHGYLDQRVVPIRLHADIRVDQK